MPDPSQLPQPQPELEPITNYLDYLVMERVAEFSAKILPSAPQLQKNRAEMDRFLKLLEKPGDKVSCSTMRQKQQLDRLYPLLF
jgi:hypothetical protein